MTTITTTPASSDTPATPAPPQAPPQAPAGPAKAPTGRPSSERMEILRILLLVQGATTLADAFIPALLGAPGNAVWTALGAVTLLVAAARLRASSRRLRRLVVALEVGLVVWAAIDLALALVMTGQPLELVPLVTRFVLPIAVLRLIRKARRESMTADDAEVTS